MLGLTRQERQVILFLSGVCLVGIAAGFFLKKYPQAEFTVFFTQDPSKIDVNTADKEILMNVNGIGEKLAQRIIAYRKAQGYFKQLEDLRQLQGMTRYRYEKIKDHLTIGK